MVITIIKGFKFTYTVDLLRLVLLITSALQCHICCIHCSAVHLGICLLRWREVDEKTLSINSPLHIIIFDEIDAICCQRESLVRGGVERGGV